MALKPQYPAAVDTFPTYVDGDVIDAQAINGIHLVVLAVQATIGKGGAKGSAASVKARLAVGMRDDGRFMNEILFHPGLAWMTLYEGGDDSITKGAYFAGGLLVESSSALTMSCFGGSSTRYMISDTRLAIGPLCAMQHQVPGSDLSDCRKIAFTYLDTPSPNAPGLFITSSIEWTEGLGGDDIGVDFSPGSSELTVSGYCHMFNNFTVSLSPLIGGIMFMMYPRKFDDTLWATRPLYLGEVG